MTEYAIEVPEEWEGERIDKALGELLKLSRSRAQEIIAQGGVLRNGMPPRKSTILQEGDHLLCCFKEVDELEAQPEDIPLDVRYEDDDLLVVNKPQGMVVHPAPGNWEHTLVHALLYYCGQSGHGGLSGINGVLRPGIVHRIDKDTSGLLAVAKNDLAHAGLAAQIQAHSFLREYRAVVQGRLKNPEGVVDAPIARSERDRKRMCVTKPTAANAKSARTHYSLLEEYDTYSLVRLRLETGRTHQIRVHMAHIGHPVAGDPVYGPQPPVKGLSGQCLHAGLLGFAHPRSGEWIEVVAELPTWFAGFLRLCGK